MTAFLPRSRQGIRSRPRRYGLSARPLAFEQLEFRNLPSGSHTVLEEIQPGIMMERVISEPILFQEEGPVGLSRPSANLSIQDSALGAPPLISLKKGPNLLANSAASLAFDQAAAIVSDLFNDNITVVIDAEIAPLGPNIIGSTGSVAFAKSYNTVRTMMISDRNSATESIVDGLPTSAQFSPIFPSAGPAFSFSGNIEFTRANGKALGFPDSQLSGGPFSQYDTSVRRDMNMTFSSNFSFDYDRSNGITPGLIDFIGVAVHETMHGLGFVSNVDDVDFLLDNPGFSRVLGPATLDLFRLQPGNGAANFTTSQRVMAPGSTVAQQVVYDGGRHNFLAAGFTNMTVGDIPMSTGSSNGDGRQASHWKDNLQLPGGLYIGVMDPTILGSGVQIDGFSTDVLALGLIGWDVAEDFGDAPSPYPTTGATAAQHQIVTGAFLGTRADDETDGQPNGSATGDDTVGSPSDEDGVTLPASITIGGTASITVTASKAGFLNAWVDFNDDGDWADSGEQIFTDRTLAVGANNLTFSVPGSAVATTQTFARFRYTTYNTSGSLGVTGFALDGEAEDYQLAIASTNQAPVINDQSFNLPENSANGTVVGTLTATDVDTLQTLSFSITAGNTGGAFAVNPGSGVLTVVNSAALDFETTPTFGLTVTVTDNGSPPLADTALVTITLLNANDPPTLNVISNPPAIPEESGIQTVSLAGITAGGGDTQNLTVTAVSSNTGLIPNPTVAYTSANTTGTLTYTPTANGFGTALITVTVTDDGATTGGGINTFSRTFAVVVDPVNDPPTLSAISSLILDEDAPTQTIGLSGISTGQANELQTLNVTATSTLPAIVPNPVILYTSPDSTGTLTFTPAGNANTATSGPVTISVIVNDGQGSNNTVTRTFTVTLNAVNDFPTLNTLNQSILNEDAATQTVGLSGISVGPANESGQPLNVVAVSSNPAIVPQPIMAYTGPNSTGTLTFTPAANLNTDVSGPVTVTVTVNDGQGSSNTTTRTFTVTINAINDPPTLNALNPVTLNEEASLQTVNLSGITAGPTNELGQVLTVSATSSATALIPNPTVSYTNPNSTGSLSFTPVANANGIATITVIANDGQGTNNKITRTFTVTVNAINDAPTLNNLNPVSLNEDAGIQTVNLSGITSGPANESSQSLTVTVLSSNTAIIFNPTISYTSPNTTGRLTFTPTANAHTEVSGPVTLTVTVNDGQGSNNKVTREFTVTIAAVNDAPTLNNLNPVTLNEDAPLQTVNLTSITAGTANESSQILIVTAVSSDQAIVPNPTVNYTSANTTGSLTFQPVADTNTAAGGPVTIAVTVNDGQGLNNTITRNFTITINAVNDPPTLNPLNPVALNEDAGLQTVALTGISAGPANEDSQTRVVTAVSSDPSIIPNPAISYTSPAATGSLNFAPVADANTEIGGPVTITVTVNDGQGSNNSITRTFEATVNPVNDAPTLNALNPVTLNQNAPAQAVNLTGITAGPANESGQTLSPTAISSNQALIPNPTINYTSPNGTGTLIFTPAAAASGTATISVTVNDGAGSNNTIVREFTVTII